MWPWTKQDAPQAASEPPAAAAAKAPAVSDDVWVDLLKCSLSERDSLIQTGSEEPCEFARGTVLRGGKGTERRVRLEGSELELSVHAEAVAPANPAFQDDLDDVSQLSHLNEASLLHHIASRYLEQHQIYTRAGPVLVAMNPFKRLPALYSDEQLARYQTSTAAAAAEEGGAPQHAPPPHVYKVAGVVYNSLRLRGASQSVVINGESWGVYANVQQFDSKFTQDFFGTPKGARWKIPGSPAGEGGMIYLGDEIEYAESPMDAIEGADALVIVTEWNEFRRPDFEALRSGLKQPVIFDGRNIFPRKTLEELGFTYHALGR